MTFESWKSDFLIRAADDGVPAAILNQVSPFLTSAAGAARADMAQPEARKTLQHYVERAVSDKRVAQGRMSLAQYDAIFDQIESDYQVDRHVVAAIWGMESNYGSIRGDVPVISALATLAAQGRRAPMFESQLLAAFEIVTRGIKTPEQMLGSWAGAMGHTQFMPKSYIDFAVSANNGRPDIWAEDPADALVSTAHFLVCHGWKGNLPWGTPTDVPKTENLHGLRHLPPQNLTHWNSLGILPQRAGAINYEARLILPGGVASLGFVVSENFDALLRYNNAAAYAIAVGHLADRLKGAPALTFPPGGDARGLTQPEMRFVQSRLTELGFDTLGADGFSGPKTEMAAEAFQATQGLPVDGFVGLALLRRLGTL